MAAAEVLRTDGRASAGAVTLWLHRPEERAELRQGRSGSGQGRGRGRSPRALRLLPSRRSPGIRAGRGVLRAGPGSGRGRTARAGPARLQVGARAARGASPAPAHLRQARPGRGAGPEASGAAGGRQRRSGREAAGAGIPAAARAGARGAARAAPAGSRALLTLAHLRAAPQLSSARRRGERAHGGGGRPGRSRGRAGRDSEAQDSVEGTLRRRAPRTRREDDAEEATEVMPGARRRPRPPFTGLTSARRAAGWPRPSPARYKGRLQRRKAASVAYPRWGPGGGCAWRMRTRA